MTEPQSKGAANPTQAFEVLRRAAVAPSPFVQVLLSCLERRATGSLSVMLSGRSRLWVRIEGDRLVEGDRASSCKSHRSS